jgi:MFS family permease
LVIGLLWAGEERGWTSATTLTLFGVAAVGAIVFVLVEFRATEPILPLSLFSNRIVRTTLIGGFVSGVAVYALSAYSPVFMQLVQGASATESGLWSIPNMAMVTFASITSGRLIARYGNYRPYPILGCAFMLLGAVLLATMDVHTSVPGIAARSALIGLGMGQIGPSMNLIVQNAVRYQDLGVATAGLTFIRSLGGVLGSAVLGAVYRNRLDVLIPRYVGADTVNAIGLDRLEGRPAEIQALAEPVRSQTLRAFADSMTTTFTWAIPVLVVAVVVFVMVPVIPLRDDQ